MDDVVAELRERLQRRRLKPSLEVLEHRLRRACIDSRGHLLVTGSDRAEIHTILGRVLDELEPLSAIRTLAVDDEPYATVDRVITAVDPDAALDDYLDRRAALVALLERAQQADKAIFVVVDDADRATIDQLEHLRTSLEIAPEASECIRLVFVGDETLSRRLEDPAARDLRTRIAATVSMDGLEEIAAAVPRRKTVASHALTLATVTTVVFCTAVYATYLVGLMTGGGKRSRDTRAPQAAAAPLTRADLYGIRGDEEFLRSPLRIDSASSPRKKITAPAPALARAATPSTTPASAPIVAKQAPPARSAANAAATNGPVAAARAPAPAQKPSPPPQPARGATPSPGSSIEALMKQFH